MQVSGLKWNTDGLLTVVVQHRMSGDIRMVAHANLEAVGKTLETGLAHFFSRSRQALWCKGETSGHTIAVHSIFADCDGDALVYLAEPKGPSCHTGEPTCFFRPVTKQGVADSPAGMARPVLSELWATLQSRNLSGAAESYTKRLLTKGPAKIGEKVTEEAGEFVQAICQESEERVASEASDVLYHLLVGLLSRGVDLTEVQAELASRFGISGLVEKASR